MPTGRRIHIDELTRDQSLQLELVCGAEGLSRSVEVPEVQKPGLALAGHLESLHPDRIQVLGFSEISYLESLSVEVATTRVQDLVHNEIPCIVVTRSLEVPEVLSRGCQEQALPLLRTRLSSSRLIRRLHAVLALRLNPSSSCHGVLVDVFGVGVLLLGKSGVGKSEVALELLLRGHRLVADDIVELQRTATGTLIGAGPDIIKHHMEVRGLGILNIKDLFGIAAVRDTKRIDLVAELADWAEIEEHDRVGIEDQTFTVLGVDVPKICLPVRPGRNMTAIIEVAARNQLLKVRGHHSAREFQDRLVRAIAQGADSGTLRWRDEE